MGGNESRPPASSVSAPPRVRSASNPSLSNPLAVKASVNLNDNLKVFLRSSNLSGLEYRLRLAGYRSLEDLLKTNEEKLKASGLTPLMTSRLIAALAEYHRSDRKPVLHSKVVMRQKVNVAQRPSEDRAAIRKPNVKRAHSQGQVPSEQGPPRRSAPQVKVLSSADVPDAHLISRENSFDQPDSPSSRRRSVFASKGTSLQTSMSLPHGLYSGEVNLGLFDLPRRSYSCPVSINCPPVPSASSVLAQAIHNEDPDECAIALKLLCQTYSQQPHLKPSSSDLELAIKALQLWYEDVLVAERGCQLIKYLTRGMDAIPSSTILAVLDAMCSHRNEAKVQLQAYLAAANIGRKVPYNCKAIVFRGGISAVVSGMEHFHDNCSIQIAGLSLLAVAFAGEPEGKLKYLTQHVKSIDQVVTTMQIYKQDVQVLENSCAFLALLLVGVCHQMECAVLFLLVEEVLQSMSTYLQNEALQVWGCKIISHATTSDLFSDSKLATRCVQAVIDAVNFHRTTPAVQTWGAYCLYQIICYYAQNTSIVTMGHRGVIVELCQTRASGLTEEANFYLTSLQSVLEV